MRPKKPLSVFVFILLLICFAITLTSWVSNSSAAAPLPQAGTGPADLYLPFIMKMIPPTPTSTPTPPTSGCPAHYFPFEERLYELINNIRQDNGLATLSVSYPLEISSGVHSDDMAVNHFMSHVGSDGSTACQRAVAAGYPSNWCAEIIVTARTPEEAVDWWMNEPLHHDMIVGNFHDFGAGYAYCAGSYGGYFTVDFGHR